MLKMAKLPMLAAERGESDPIIIAGGPCVYDPEPIADFFDLINIGEGEEVLVSLYIDKSERLCATMNVYHELACDSPYQKDDRVTGTVYEISPNFGAFVAVDDKYSGLIAKKELYGNIQIGDVISARVLRVKEDGKLDLSVREKAYLQISTDAEDVMRLIDRFGGALPFNDKASPEVIKRETGMSKNEFKRAVGNLLKNNRIKC
jgi:predicted RNA-binding protein (virulence factor B family)